MPFEILRNDITKMSVDVIVNSANPQPVIGAGTDGMIHAVAGPRLLKARQKIGAIDVGCAAVTDAYGLQSKYVIHTVGPIWQGGDQGEAALLRQCYDRSLELAAKKQCRSIAFPLISSGAYGFPKDKALQIAISAFSAFLTEQEMQVYLVVFDRGAFQLSEQLFRGVASYIDENYVDTCHQAFPEALSRRQLFPQAPPPSACRPMACEEAKPLSLDEMLRQEDTGFSETLLKLIDRQGKKDSDIYKKANLSKQHFSKIRNNALYKPTKPTAIALALALELDLEETRDLIGRAGYALTNSSKFDLIIRYCIEHKLYNVMEINCILFEHDQNLLGT